MSRLGIRLGSPIHLYKDSLARPAGYETRIDRHRLDRTTNGKNISTGKCFPPSCGENREYYALTESARSQCSLLCQWVQCLITLTQASIHFVLREKLLCPLTPLQAERSTTFKNLLHHYERIPLMRQFDESFTSSTISPPNALGFNSRRRRSVLYEGATERFCQSCRRLCRRYCNIDGLRYGVHPYH